MRVDILLTHHGTHQLDRCIKVGRAYLCARCAGMYPALAIGLWMTLSGSPDLELGAPFAYGMSAVGVTAWGIERLRPVRFVRANLARAFFGAVLGLGIGAMLGRHFREPFAPAVVGQIVLIASLAVGFCLVDLLGSKAVRKHRDCDENHPSPGAGLP